MSNDEEIFGLGALAGLVIGMCFAGLIFSIPTKPEIFNAEKAAEISTAKQKELADEMIVDILDEIKDAAGEGKPGVFYPTEERNTELEKLLIKMNFEISFKRLLHITFTSNYAKGYEIMWNKEPEVEFDINKWVEDEVAKKSMAQEKPEKKA